MTQSSVGDMRKVLMIGFAVRLCRDTLQRFGSLTLALVVSIL